MHTIVTLSDFQVNRVRGPKSRRGYVLFLFISACRPPLHELSKSYLSQFNSDLHALPDFFLICMHLIGAGRAKEEKHGVGVH